MWAVDVSGDSLAVSVRQLYATDQKTEIVSDLENRPIYMLHVFLLEGDAVSPVQPVGRLVRQDVPRSLHLRLKSIKMAFLRYYGQTATIVIFYLLKF